MLSCAKAVEKRFDVDAVTDDKRTHRDEIDPAEIVGLAGVVAKLHPLSVWVKSERERRATSRGSRHQSVTRGSSSGPTSWRA